ncbi:helix-turn-helix domain-containing protein [Solwaraspora sp. WMMD1047]|uniref:winged helix-turn-helix transcriptional regulator n=1 Tax=Solwaraspora sp. WMMD1047 TaxID=3016102 RepID=UPI002417249B|nr:helix-turn-helix domain-containing protein [Solwaraspora sp. WMMD1047]MDG4832029.1 helix-turn-helix domain-containing protein [Solwaraspora sp. WMMD1047]
MVTLPAAARRERDRQRYNANLAGCPGHELLATLSDKWVTLVLSALADGPRRYSELSRTISGASQKMLTQTLRKLERDGLLTRAVTPSVPVRVDYRLTPLGESLLPVQRAIKDWAETHIEQVHAARASYDGTRAVESEVSTGVRSG